MIFVNQLVFVLVLSVSVVVGGGVDDVESQSLQTCCICFEQGSTPLAVVKKPNKLSNFLRGFSSVSATTFNCCHADQFLKTCVEAWVDRERHDCPICREKFRWNLGRWITFLESDSSREVIEYGWNSMIGMVGFVGSTMTLDQFGLKSETTTSILVVALLAWTLFSLFASIRDNPLALSWDYLRYMRYIH
jgi:hypothetical protein